MKSIDISKSLLYDTNDIKELAIQITRNMLN